MEALNYRDPLLGIVILLLIGSSIILISYFWNKYKEKSKGDSLRDFINRFDYIGFDDEVKKFLSLSNNPTPSLVFVAKIYEKNGEYEKAINLYLTAIETVSETKQKIPILELLGNLYKKAGFLMRSKDIFMQILQYYPRDIKTLYSFVEVSQALADYKSALEGLDCLRELGEDTSATYYYFKAKLLLQETQNSSLSTLPQKIKTMQDLLEQQPLLLRIALRFYLQYAPNLFWQCFKTPHNLNILEFLDILWNIPPHLLNQEVIANNPTLNLIFTLKFSQEFLGRLAYNSQNNDKITWSFELEVLYLLQNYSKTIQNLPHYHVDLDFTYTCKICHFSSPIEFERCKECGSSLEVCSNTKLKVIPKERLENEERLSFL